MKKFDFARLRFARLRFARLCFARLRFASLSLFIAALILGSFMTDLHAQDLENIIHMETKHGTIVMEMRPDLAPKHVERIKRLTREKFYDNIVFHRVIEGFMAQTGDPTGTGRGGSEYPDLEAEFSNEPFKRGTVGMARAASPNSANSQFFICFDDAQFLNGQYTVFAVVIEGMDVVDKIKKGDQDDNGAVQDPDRIISMRVGADLK